MVFCDYHVLLNSVA